MLRSPTASLPSFIQNTLSRFSAAKFLSSFPDFQETRAQHQESSRLCLSLLHRHLSNNKIIHQVHSWLLTNGILLYQESNGRLLLFNALLRCYSLGQTPLQAFLLYKQQKSPCFDSFTYSFLLKASASLLYPELGDQVHGLTVKLGFGSHVYVQTALIDMYVVVRKLVEAHKVFDEMPERNPVSWNVLITGMINWGELQTAVSLFEEMPVRTVVSWTGVIDGYTRMNRFDEAKALFRRMIASDGIKPNAITILAIFPAISNKGELRMCKSIHGYAGKSGLFDIRVTNAQIDAYAKCGCINSASRFFEEISDERKNLVSWTSIISAFAMHGMGKEAVDSFATMEKTGLKPNQVTFLSLLNACSHGGLVEEGLKFFKIMVSYYEIAPEIKHYGCLADMLGRSGRLEEAEKLVLEIPNEKSNVVLWKILLGACSFYGNVEMGERVNRKIMEYDKGYDGAHVIMSNIYSTAGRFTDAENFRKSMDNNNAPFKVPGRSLI